MQTEDYQTGDKIYYTGDMANQPGVGIITKVRPANKYAPVSYDINFMAIDGLEDSREMKGVYHLSFTPGPGRRFWLYSEWQEKRNADIESMKQRMAQLV